MSMIRLQDLLRIFIFCFWKQCVNSCSLKKYKHTEEKIIPKITIVIHLAYPWCSVNIKVFSELIKMLAFFGIDTKIRVKLFSVHIYVI